MSARIGHLIEAKGRQFPYTYDFGDSRELL